MFKPISMYYYHSAVHRHYELTELLTGLSVFKNFAPNSIH